jgi:hypothetical protein
MVDSANERLKKIIFQRLSDELGGKIFYPVGRSIWLLDLDTKEWYFEIICTGDIWYNQKYFNQFFNVFTLKYYEYQIYLKSWIGKHPYLMIKNIQRRNTNYEYYIEGIINDTKHYWSLKDRHGFSYLIVKHYLDCLNKCGSKSLTIDGFWMSDRV